MGVLDTSDRRFESYPPDQIMYIEQDYKEAINFALNYPPEFDFVSYNEDKDLYRVYVFDAGWYDINLEGNYVRSCLKWKGKKVWIQ